MIIWHNICPKNMLSPAQSLMLMLVVCLPFLGACDQFYHLRKPEQSQTLLIAGSSSLKPVSEKLIAAFVAKYPDSIVVCEGGGSTGGLMALRRSSIDVAALSRDVRRIEDAKNIITLPLARNGIGFIVHSSNILTSLSPTQLRDMLTGRVHNWATVGGTHGPVAVHSRGKNSTTLRAVDDLLLNGDDIVKAAKRHATAEDLAQAVGADPAGVGFVSWADSNALSSDVQAKIKFLAVNHVPMHRNTLLSGRYPMTRVFSYALRDDASPTARQFVDFTMSAEGQRILREEGLLTVR